MTSRLFSARARRCWREDIRPLLVLALVLFSVRSSIADWNDVPTGSMKPLVLEGDRVFVNKLAYDLKLPFTTVHLAEWAAPKRGDIVVFYSPHDEKRLLKRVVGLPGDLVELRGNGLLLNGVPVQYGPLESGLVQDVSAEDRIRQRYAREELPGRSHPIATIPLLVSARDFGPYRVPDGHYFMMGDNRDDSFDSRYFGPVERKRILGKVNGIALSFDRENFWAPRFGRFFNSLNK